MHSVDLQIVSRPRRWRLRWFAIAVAAPLFGVVAAFGTVQNASEPVPVQTVVEPLELPAVLLGDIQPVAYFREERFQGGSTVAALLDHFGTPGSETTDLLRSSQAVRSLRLLQPGTTVGAKIGEDGTLRSLWFFSRNESLVSIDRLGEGFSASRQQVVPLREIEMKSGEVSTSLFAATDAAGVPDNAAIQLAEIFAGDVDFNRDLRRGDRFAVVFETFRHDGRTLRTGRVLAAEFSSQRKTYRAVWFQHPWGKGGYYTPDGQNLRRAFLRSPIEFSRVTSRVGFRHHPIFQQWRAHRGVDYAAPAGARVRATGGGIVEFAGRRGGYGNLLVVGHHGGYRTYYAHLSGFARGVKGGARISQGDVIGYVGQTGWATGSHLHYEFHVRDQYRDPLTITFPSAAPIAPNELAAFGREAEPLVARLDLLKNSNLALLE